MASRLSRQELAPEEVEELAAKLRIGDIAKHRAAGGLVFASESQPDKAVTRYLYCYFADADPFCVGFVGAVMLCWRWFGVQDLACGLRLWA
jgi:hypothetical protein